MAAAVARLPDDLQQVVTLRAFEDLTWPDIARQTGLTESAVRRRWTQAVVRLKKLLAEPS